MHLLDDHLIPLQIDHPIPGKLTRFPFILTFYELHKWQARIV
jgi:hypothetical protein